MRNKLLFTLLIVGALISLFFSGRPSVSISNSISSGYHKSDGYVLNV